MKLLVSPINVDESIQALEGGADIIDVKNPKEGSLGANFPRVISDIKKAINGKAPLSAAIGDMDFKPGTASLAALGATVAGVDYVKIGLFGVRTKDEARELLEEVVHAVKDYREETYVVAAAYADYERVGAVSPYELPAIGKDVGLDVVMVDTGIKDGKTCFDFM
ncbi:MAG: (5-formylfuran-3-yl)methyl phosphate synthase, partial [Methermicoccaceae archaeon]